MIGPLCCVGWARDRDQWQKHHPNCPLADPVGELKALLAKIAEGLEMLSSDCGGIPDYLWEPYRKAALVGGRWIAEKEPT